MRDLLPDVRKVLEGFDTDIFVRSIEGDGDPGWALRLAPYLAALGRLTKASEGASKILACGGAGWSDADWWTDKLPERLRAQDNRATSHPIFVVQQRRRVYGFDPSSGDGIAWLGDESEVEESLAFSLEAGYQKNHHEPDGYTRTAYKDEYEFVTACLTEAAADAYIVANRHNLCDPRVYAASGYRNSEWIAVREFFLHLAEAQ